MPDPALTNPDNPYAKPEQPPDRVTAGVYADDVKVVSKTIRKELFSHPEVRRIFTSMEVHRIFKECAGDTKRTLAELQEKGLVHLLYNTIQTAIDDRGAEKERVKLVEETESAIQQLQHEHQVKMKSPLLLLHLKQGKAFLDHLDPAEFVGCELHVQFCFGGHARKVATPIEISGACPEWNEIFQWEVLDNSADALHDGTSGGEMNVEGELGTGGFYYSADNSNLERAREYALLNRGRNAYGNNSANDTNRVGDPDFGTGKNFNPRDQILLDFERANLMDFQIIIFRYWPHRGDKKVEVISSTPIELKEGSHWYEVKGVEKRCQLTEGLIELEVQWVGGEWPLKPKLLDFVSAGKDKNSESSKPEPFFQYSESRGEKLRKCFQELDRFAGTLSNHFEKNIDFYSQNENGVTLPLCEFVRRVTNGDRFLPTPIHALRFVNLFPSRDARLFDKRDHICWRSLGMIFAQREITDIEKSLLLCGLFLGSWDLEAYVCLGRDKDTETPISWVMTVGAEPENPTLWDPVTAERFRASDPEASVKFHSFDVAFSDHFLFVNPDPQNRDSSKRSTLHKLRDARLRHRAASEHSNNSGGNHGTYGGAPASGGRGPSSRSGSRPSSAGRGRTSSGGRVRSASGESRRSGRIRFSEGHHEAGPGEWSSDDETGSRPGRFSHLQDPIPDDSTSNRNYRQSTRKSGNQNPGTPNRDSLIRKTRLGTGAGSALSRGSLRQPGFKSGRPSQSNSSVGLNGLQTYTSENYDHESAETAQQLRKLTQNARRVVDGGDGLDNDNVSDLSPSSANALATRARSYSSPGKRSSGALSRQEEEEIIDLNQFQDIIESNISSWDVRSWIQFENPLPPKPPISLRMGDRFFNVHTDVGGTGVQGVSIAAEENAARARERQRAEHLVGAGRLDRGNFPSASAGFSGNSNVNPERALHPISLNTLGAGCSGNLIPRVEERVENLLRRCLEETRRQHGLACGPNGETIGRPESGFFADVENQRNRNQALTPVIWDRKIEASLGFALYNAEQKRVKLENVEALECFEEIAKAKFFNSNHTKSRSNPNGLNEKLVAFPVQFNHLNADVFWTTLMRSEVVQNMVCVNDPISHPRYALRCKIFEYPENVTAVWVMLALRTVG